MVDVTMTDQPCDAEAGRVNVDGDKLFVATGDQWLELTRVLHHSKLVTVSEILCWLQN